MMLYLNLRKRGVKSGLLFLVSLLVIGVIVTKTWGVPGKAVKIGRASCRERV